MNLRIVTPWPSVIRSDVWETWDLARELYDRQCQAFTFADRWDELDLDSRIDWWVKADKERHPESYR